MGKIVLRDLRFYAYHGVYEEERLTGNHFTIDIDIESPIEAAAMTDEIGETINYETVYLICQSVMRRPTKLLETLVVEIMEGLKHQFLNMTEVRIKLSKANPIPGERMASAAIEITENFMSSCPRCGSPYINYGAQHGWRRAEQVLYPGTVESLQERYGRGICANCIEQYRK